MPNGNDDPGRNGPLADRIERLRDPLAALAREVPAGERREPRPGASSDPREWEGWDPFEQPEATDEKEDPEAPDEAADAAEAGDRADGTGGTRDAG
ncbi:hypothetical protein [Streptomyces sp. NPDC004134]|uniref:hypothetical protein n=1 Tax=Streptomyces sp. NPDC004134 TaxID=3364691 RepID=UPI003673BC66